MSHYWSLEGEVKFSREINKVELERIAGLFDCEVEELSTGVGWNTGDSTIIVGNTLYLDGNESHFPSMVGSIMDIVQAPAEGSGTYHAEDSMAGEWEIKDGKFLTKEYKKIVEELRKKLNDI